MNSLQLAKKSHWTQGLDQCTPDRDRQTEAERKYESHISVAGDKETQPLNLSLSKIKSQGTSVSTYFLDSHFEHSAWSVVMVCC